MAELDTIHITNPMKEDFSVNFNGESYHIGSEETKSFPEFLAFHIAKHLSDRMLGDEVKKIKAKQTENPFRPEVGQLMVYDNPKRRIALYEILKSKDKVEACVRAYPFKGFLGEISEYDDYVTKVTKSAEKSEKPSKAQKAETTDTANQ